MAQGSGRLRDQVERQLWPVVDDFVASQPVAGLAIAVVADGESVMRGFGVRDVRSRMPVTPETVFHLASVSKPFVATAIASLAGLGDAAGTGTGTASVEPQPPRPTREMSATRQSLIDLDTPITARIPEFTLADGRQHEVTPRHLLSHTSGLPDVSDYGWHDPQLGDEALADLARSMTGWRLQTEPGVAFAYSNAGYDLLGLLLARATGMTFEDAVAREVLAPMGMRESTFRRADVPGGLTAAPHVGMPLTVPGDAYPYTRRHAPSSSLHSNLVDLCRWIIAHLAASGAESDAAPNLDPVLREAMWRPVAEVGDGPFDEAMGLGWALGHHRGHRSVGHSGLDPGFGSRLTLLPDAGIGVVVLYNSNTVPASALTRAALDVALEAAPAGGQDLQGVSHRRGDAAGESATSESGEGLALLRAMRPSVVVPLAEALSGSGEDAAAAEWGRLSAADPPAYDLDLDEGFEEAVWGAIELHRTPLVWPLLRLWVRLRPDSTAAWTMTAWAHEVDGAPGPAREAGQRALDLDPGNDEAARIVARLPSD